MYHAQRFETGSPCSFSQDSMDVGLLVHNYAALESPEETMQTKIWALQEELCQKAAMVAELKKLPMEYFYVSAAELKELANDKERFMLLTLKLRTVDNLLAEWQDPASVQS